MTLTPTKINNCYLIDNFYHTDHRGSFTKFYNDREFHKFGFQFTPKESYFSKSKKNVIRGMHYQKIPNHHDKLVTCIQGKILDVILDLRIDSETFGKFDSFYLDQKNNKSIFISAGVAHGFLTIEDDSITLYNVTTGYDKNSDCGILWNSFGFDWPILDPIISERDNDFSLFSHDHNFLT